MKNLRCLFLFCLFLNTGFAQHGFDPGYIINHNRDTVWGLIETTEEKNLSGSVHFKKETNSELKEYYPGDLFGFGINPEPYRSIRFINTIDGNTSDTVFARQLVSGQYNLLFFFSLMSPRMVQVPLNGLQTFATISTLSASTLINLETGINR